MYFEITRMVLAPREVVWRVLTRWEAQPDWMVDARAVEVLTPQRTGRGVTLRCPTSLLGITVEDVMRVTTWEEPARLGVTHLGRIITGDGAFVLSELGGRRTRLTWWEHIEPPLGAVGTWAADRLARPLLTRVFAHSLGELARLAEVEAAEAATGRGPAVRPHGRDGP